MPGAFSQDIRQALRGFARSPGFTAVALLVLTLGAGANTAIFSIVNAVLLRPLPFQEPGRLVAIRENSRSDPKIPLSPRDLDAWQRRSRTLEAVVGYRSWEYSWTGMGDARKITGEIVTLNFFRTLGVAPARGRLFTESDRNGPLVVVISDAFWRAQLGAAEDVLGRTLILDGKPHVVIGVLPPGFQFQPPRATLWTPFTPASDYYRICPPLEHGFFAFGRLRPGVNEATARSDLLRIRRALEETEPEYFTDMGVMLRPLQEEFAAIEGDLRPALLTLFVAVVFVLLIGCANVASLLLGRAASRQKEIAVRAALGCGRWRMMRHMLTESLLLSTAGTALGALVAWAGVYWFRRAAPIQLPAAADVRMDMPVLLFTAALALGTGVVFGLLPALKASRLDLTGVLKETRSSRGLRSQRARSLLVVAEVAFSLVLLAGASLLIESFVRLRSEPLGFRTDHAAIMSFDLPENVYKEPAQRRVLIEHILNRVRSLPGVESSVTSGAMPQILLVESRPMPGSPAEYAIISGEFSTPGYFRVLGVPLLRGRYPDERDNGRAEKVAVINQELARRYFAGADPIGQRIAFGEPKDHTAWMKIVGIVGSTRRISSTNDMKWETAPVAYAPLAQAEDSYTVFLQIVARGEASRYPDAHLLLKDVRSSIRDADFNLPVYHARTMHEQVFLYDSGPRFRAVLLGWFALLAVILAAVGLYGVISQAVVQQTREIGIRVAIGARPRDVERMIVQRGLALALIGVVLGVSGSLMLSPLLASMLYGVGASSPVTLAAVSVLMLAVAALASWLPALRATRVDPVQTLRYE
jgi:putative ABC transport system permease protein